MKRIFVILFLLTLFPSLAVAGADDYVPSPITINTSTLPVVVIGPADAHTYPRVIGELTGVWALFFSIELSIFFLVLHLALLNCIYYYTIRLF